MNFVIIIFQYFKRGVHFCDYFKGELTENDQAKWLYPPIEANQAIISVWEKKYIWS